jgi:hypothetical protein
MKLAFARLQHGLFRRAGIDPRGYRRSGRVAAAFSHRSNAAELHSTRKDAESNTVRRRVIVEMPQIRDAIELTEIEQDLFSDLLDAARKVIIAPHLLSSCCRLPNVRPAAPTKQSAQTSLAQLIHQSPLRFYRLVFRLPFAPQGAGFATS